MVNIIGRANNTDLTPPKVEPPHHRLKVIDQVVRLANAQDWPVILHMADLLWHLDPAQSNVIPDNATIFVACRKDQIVGMVVCHQPTDGQMPISHLYVTETNTGIGSALLKSAIAFAGDNTEIYLVVDRTNKRLKRFYHRFGFRPAPLIYLRRPAA